MADCHGGPVLCHNDVCLENIVFRNGRAIALLDFDLAAPGRRVFDVASFARMCIPVDDETNASRSGWPAQDLPSRLRLVADAYGLEAVDRLDLLEILGRAIERGGEFVRRRVEAGEPGFVKMWEEMGGEERSTGDAGGGPANGPTSRRPSNSRDTRRPHDATNRSARSGRYRVGSRRRQCERPCTGARGTRRSVDLGGVLEYRLVAAFELAADRCVRRRRRVTGHVRARS